jgi:exonuclease VII small subunit
MVPCLEAPKRTIIDALEVVVERRRRGEMALEMSLEAFFYQ